MTEQTANTQGFLKILGAEDETIFQVGEFFSIGQ